LSIFDLLFILIFLASVVVLLAAAVFAIRRQGAHAARILRAYAIGMGVYFATIILVSLFLPRHVLRVGVAQCFDDWCIAVDQIDRTPSGAKTYYCVELSLSSRARRVSQRENGVVVYLTDQNERRYDPIPARSITPINILLEPGDSVKATRVFELPAEASGIGLIIAHEGGFPIGWFIIGYETWFRKPTIVPISPG
jgi:hypothetical protein